ncbi:hypothetical protein [Lysobacter enzymogenes]|uniref:hypothetical protein n=1 Tax=Lysobacter enzymogenes TaxID=69 RepID=UPI0019D20302|nr:hypothetical protein [Lysobacter enzymogenes]
MRIETSRAAARTRSEHHVFCACTCLWNACACSFVAPFASAHRTVDSTALTERIVQTGELAARRMSMPRGTLIAKPMRRALASPRDALDAFDAERFVHDAMPASTRGRMRCVRSPHSPPKLNRPFMRARSSALRTHGIGAIADTNTDARRTRTHEHINKKGSKRERAPRAGPWHRRGADGAAMPPRLGCARCAQSKPRRCCG